MKHLLVATLIGSVALTTSLVRAQSSLYGAPAMLDLPQAQAAPTGNSPAPMPPASGYRTASVSQPAYLPSNTAYAQQVSDVSTAAPQYTSGPSQPPPTAVAPNPLPSGTAPAMNPAAAPASGAYGPNPCAQDFSCGSSADQWYASMRGLVMGRGESPKIWTSANSNDNADQLLNTQVNERWAGGWDVVLGRSFCCGQYSLEAEYWGLAEFGGQASTSPSQGPVNLTFQDNNLAFTQGATTYTGQQMFDGAVSHSIQRENDVQSVEINLFRNHCCSPGNLDVAFSGGVRYFRFRDQLDFTSCTNYAAPFDQAQLDDRVVNNLIGFQFGADVNYNLGCNWHFFLNPKIGIYDNHMNLNYNLTNSCGTPAMSTDPNVPGCYPVNSSKDGLAFMTQIDLGLGYQFACHWDAFIGYRVVFATGMGLADNQLPQYFVDLPGIADIKHSGDLVLSGAFAGLTYCF